MSLFDLRGVLMRNLKKFHLLLVMILSILLIFPGCSTSNLVKETYDLDQFVNELKSKKLKPEVIDIEEITLHTEAKRVNLKDEELTVYIFESSDAMEKASKGIDPMGSKIDNGSSTMFVSWSSKPHWYKKGSIIVLYVGENKEIISDLNSIFGRRFAGHW
jgi:hypothetical protein